MDFRKGLLERLTAKLINFYKIQRGDLGYYDNYDYWQKRGFHIIPNHYYQPIPDTSALTDKDFGRKNMQGIDMNDDIQLENLNKLAKFKSEFKSFNVLQRDVNTQKDPSFYFGNMAFDGIDALTYYGMIRSLEPKTILEIGSGWSTKIAAAACLRNDSGKLISIEPYPQPILKKGFPGLSELIERKVEDIPPKFFDKLNSGDILFVDSSHTVKIGGDVNYIFFEILPRINKGVYVHLHDIFLPYDYPKDWVLNERRFWAEQYLLHAFLLFNDTFEIVFVRGYLNNKYPRAMKKAFPDFVPIGGGSFWMRKVK